MGIEDSKINFTIKITIKIRIYRWNILWNNRCFNTILWVWFKWIFHYFIEATYYSSKISRSFSRLFTNRLDRRDKFYLVKFLSNLLQFSPPVQPSNSSNATEAPEHFPLKIQASLFFRYSIRRGSSIAVSVARASNALRKIIENVSTRKWSRYRVHSSRMRATDDALPFLDRSISKQSFARRRTGVNPVSIDLEPKVTRAANFESSGTSERVIRERLRKSYRNERRCRKSRSESRELHQLNRIVAS